MSFNFHGDRRIVGGNRSFVVNTDITADNYMYAYNHDETQGMIDAKSYSDTFFGSVWVYCNSLGDVRWQVFTHVVDIATVDSPCIGLEIEIIGGELFAAIFNGTWNLDGSITTVGRRVSTVGSATSGWHKITFFNGPTGEELKINDAAQTMSGTFTPPAGIYKYTVMFGPGTPNTYRLNSFWSAMDSTITLTDFIKIYNEFLSGNVPYKMGIYGKSPTGKYVSTYVHCSRNTPYDLAVSSSFTVVGVPNYTYNQQELVKIGEV